MDSDAKSPHARAAFFCPAVSHSYSGSALAADEARLRPLYLSGNPTMVVVYGGLIHKQWSYDMILFRALVLVGLLSASCGAFAQGEYDGVWAIQYGGDVPAYASLHSQGSEILVAVLDTRELDWEALTGTCNGNVCSFESYISGVYGTYEAWFSSPTTGTFTQRSCTPVVDNFTCMFPDNVPIDIVKVW